MSHPVRLAPFNADFTAQNGPIDIERRSMPNGLSELSAGIVRFPDGGRSEPWTLPYEEAFYVIDGELSLHVGDETIVVPAGEVVTLEKGCTVEYEGTPGTNAFFCLVPANWLETMES
ncbi:cupin domain-containing protein [Aeromicrobium tamlense]|uniref:Cupin domain-containing protein n=1 Tax=Aeromicrobium tamlense TaxID=375541 RepID=A0A8I0FWY5_9ACTN|nr:cupin domain-containing protein [Aeromicrobium tamlense]MBD1269457.1 cupin domain-containing protein [Aeromicrobium tamlense]NYI36634.1 ethanolamine utilization protein EutQ [Aeromicrobium tamlense]